MEEDTSLVWRKTLLVWRNAFYLDSLNINDLTLPNSTWLYRDGDNSAEALLLSPSLSPGRVLGQDTLLS